MANVEVKKDYSAEALLRKEKEVELDTDNVKAQDIEVKEETKKEETNNELVKDLLLIKHHGHI